ncbi:MAG TPA: hypothetical protein VKS25_00835 [Solirubrobacteraceae bacterium]|nr:hypothetical protein [Solirubrobacteraceae bacterium]
MAGHSKWAKVKRIKAVVDVRRGKLFSRLSREITIVARAGGGDPAKLDDAFGAAKAALERILS